MQNTFTDFLKFAVSQTEVALVIARDENELKELQQELNTKGYQQKQSAQDVMDSISNPSKSYLIVQDQLAKDVYDFVIQYPTGQVGLFNKKTMKTVSKTPLYKDVSIIFLITKETLAQIQKSNLQILRYVGITYQN